MTGVRCCDGSSSEWDKSLLFPVYKRAFSYFVGVIFSVDPHQIHLLFCDLYGKVVFKNVHV